MRADKTVSKTSIPGQKKIKKRITVAVTSNADGSANMPLLFIGTTYRPRCFGKKSEEELGLEYDNGSKG